MSVKGAIIPVIQVPQPGHEFELADEPSATWGKPPPTYGQPLDVVPGESPGELADAYLGGGVQGNGELVQQQQATKVARTVRFIPVGNKISATNVAERVIEETVLGEQTGVSANLPGRQGLIVPAGYENAVAQSVAHEGEIGPSRQGPGIAVLTPEELERRAGALPRKKRR